MFYFVTSKIIYRFISAWIFESLNPQNIKLMARKSKYYRKKVKCINVHELQIIPEC